MATALQLGSPLSITEGYPAGGTFDELFAADGTVGPQWLHLLGGLDRLTHAQRLERIDRINLRVREVGIAHDLFSDPTRTSQPWRVDLVPLIFAPDTWAAVERAVIQRARLFEALLADLYGPQSLMKRGLVPSQLVFRDPSFLRACHGIEPSQRRVQFFATDLMRRADGSWRVVDTHVETPAGIGYALANRTVLTHVAGDLFSATKARRLAPFFRQLQHALADRAQRAAPSIALLTPGPRHNDFFSHAYLARYLGLLLVEGSDLRVDDGDVYLKTLDGLKQVDLIVRAIEGSLADPLELDPSGFLGPVGLLQAVRAHPNIVANALGTAVAENRGFGELLPVLARELLGEELAIPDVDKLWLGDAAHVREVSSNLDDYFIRNATERTARPGRAAPAHDPARMSHGERQQLLDLIARDGASLVAEEKGAFGTMPSYGARGLEPVPYAVRLFAAATADGFVVMPGGLAMDVDPARSIALTDGASRDVWVISDQAQPVFKSLWRPAIDTAQVQRSPRELPSRAADNLFWLGRNVEHADWMFRVLRNCLSRVEEDNGTRQSLGLAQAGLTNLLERDDAEPVTLPAGLDEAQAVTHLARVLMTATDRPYALFQTLQHIHRISGLTRDRLSLEAWRTLNAFHASGRWQPKAIPASIGEQLDLIDQGLTAIAAFNGLSHENMTRNFGWSFLDMGRRLTRALNLARALRLAFASGRKDDDEADLGLVLDLADSFITYRSRYRLNPVLPLLLDLLIVDETNPRSIAYQLVHLSSQIEQLPQAGEGGGRTEVQRTALAALNAVRLADVSELARVDARGQRSELERLLSMLVQSLPQLSNAITRRYFSIMEREPNWVRARSRVVP